MGLSIWSDTKGLHIPRRAPRGLRRHLRGQFGRAGLQHLDQGALRIRFDPERKRFGPKAWLRGNPDPSCDFCEEREADRADDSER